MTVNDRLVHEHASGWGWKAGSSKYWTQASKRDMMERLGEYEDLMLSPAEVREILEKHRECVPMDFIIGMMLEGEPEESKAAWRVKKAWSEANGRKAAGSDADGSRAGEERRTGGNP